MSGVGLREVQTAGGIAFDGQRVLLMRKLGKGTLGFAKGHVDPDESLRQAAIREFREETRWKATIVRELGTVTRPAWEYRDDDTPSERVIQRITLFLMELVEECGDQEFEERARPEWVTPEEALQEGTGLAHLQERDFLRDVVLPHLGVVMPAALPETVQR